MSTYQLSESALAVRLKKANTRLHAKYGLLTLLVIGLGVLNYARNDQPHWQTELVALVLCAILLVAGYLNGRRAITSAERSPLEFYRVHIGSDCVDCKDSLRGNTVLHVSEIATVHDDARGLHLHGTKKGRCILVPHDLQDYPACLDELAAIGVPIPELATP